MPFAIDLSPRQSARTLEQAIRHRAEVLMEPRVWEEPEPVTCRLEPSPDSGSRRDGTATIILSYDLASDTAADTKARVEQFYNLVGTYCDFAVRLGENVYLFSADVTRVIRPIEPVTGLMIHLSRPETLQVAQRRRFRRFQLADSTKVRLSWRREGEPPNEGVGWLCNVSADGLACRTDTAVGERVWIGETIRVDFTLSPSDPQRFVFDAVVCAKTPAGSEGKSIIGMHFQIDPQLAMARQMAEALRRRLWDRNMLTSRTPDEEKF
jgi:hypothetical protein